MMSGATGWRRWYTAAEAEALMLDPLWRGRVRFTVLAPGWPWHGSGLSYPAGERWQRSYVRCLQGYLDYEVQRGTRDGPEVRHVVG